MADGSPSPFEPVDGQLTGARLALRAYRKAKLDSAKNGQGDIAANDRRKATLAGFVEHQLYDLHSALKIIDSGKGGIDSGPGGGDDPGDVYLQSLHADITQALSDIADYNSARKVDIPPKIKPILDAVEALKQPADNELPNVPPPTF